VRIVCVGGGPAGLYFSILMKRADPAHDVVVYERNSQTAAMGWGVVFWGDLLDDLRATDPETADRIAEAACAWHGQVVVLDGQASESEAFGYSIVRATLLNILVERATELGVTIEFDREISSAAELPDADVIVACDGANSAVRRLAADRFSTEVAVGRNKYLWLGTSKVFDAFTFPYVKTHAGWIWSHAYAIDEHTSTFIAECTTDTWTGLGFDGLVARDGLRLLGDLFGAYLDGEVLRSRSPDDAPLAWLEFRTITNARWYAGNTVLMGDAAHTTSFSIGSGTRLALEDAMALAAELRVHDDPQSAFAAYEQGRIAALHKSQAEARLSAKWFEDIARYEHLSADEFVVVLTNRRDPIVHKVPPKLYARTYLAVDRSAPLRACRSWLMPKVRALSGARGGDA
jgi:2-polyprenyl-6-methoxyphenol hydroxylase-like FAD-dependent oxidoreductase